MTIHFGNEKLDKFYGTNRESIEAPTTRPAMNHYWRINGNGKFSLRKGNVKTDLKKCINQSKKNTLIVDIIRSIDHYVRPHHAEQIHKLKEECDALIYLAYPDEVDVLKTLSRFVSSECFSHFKRRIDIYQIQNEFDGFLASQPELEDTDRVIFVNRRDLTKTEGLQSLYLYAKKHPSTRVVFDETSLRSLLNKLGKYEKPVTLVVMANNAGDKGKPFLDWTVNSAPDHMVKILLDFPIINYVRAIICYSGPSEASYFKTHQPDAFKEKDEGRLSRALFLYHEKDKALPFESDSFAGRIWQGVLSEQPDRPLSVSASPSYLHLDKLKHPSHFVGSEFSHPKPPRSGHGFFTYTDIPSDSLKTITLTTVDGPKAKHLQKTGKSKP